MNLLLGGLELIEEIVFAHGFNEQFAIVLEIV
jgi:hypothetical protein